jgi:hypothetical protein
VAHAITEAVRGRANKEAVLAVHRLFTGTKADLFFRPGRCFCKRGPLVKVGTKSSRPYEFFLFNDLLVQATPTVTGHYKVVRRLELDEAFEVIGIPDGAGHPRRKHQLAVMSSLKSFVAVAPSAEDKVAWLATLGDVKGQLVQTRRALGKLTKGGKGHAKSAGGADTKRLPQPIWQEDSSRGVCTRCASPFSARLRRHHCRFCGALVCEHCSEQRIRSSHAKSQRCCSMCYDKLRGDGTDPEAAASSVVAAGRSAPLLGGCGGGGRGGSCGRLPAPVDAAEEQCRTPCVLM